MLLTGVLVLLSLCSYGTLSSSLQGYTSYLTLALLAALLFLTFYKHFSSLKKFTSSFATAMFFLRHGPQAFLLLRSDNLGKEDETFSIGKNNIVVFNLNIIRHCLVLKACNYDKGGRAARLMADVIGPHGILGALDEDDHIPSYKVLNPHTKHAHRIQAFEDLVLEETDHKVQQWGELLGGRSGAGAKVDLYVDLNEIFFKVLYKFMFGIELSRKRFQHVHHLISQLERYSAVVGFVPAKLLPLYKLYRRDVPSIVKALDKVVDEIIEEGGVGSPLMELQDFAADVNGVQLRDTVKNLLFAGATTAANALSPDVLQECTRIQCRPVGRGAKGPTTDVLHTLHSRAAAMHWAEPVQSGRPASTHAPLPTLLLLTHAAQSRTQVAQCRAPSQLRWLHRDYTSH